MDRPLYCIAPILVFIPVLVSFIVIPFSQRLQVQDIDAGILVILAFSSLTVLSILMAGWSSNNKYSLIGAIRSIAQNIAYEIPLLLGLLPVIMIAGSFSLHAIVEAQHSIWFVIYQPVAFLIYFIAAVAETNRTPFDLPEAESELVAGYHTEYSGMRFALFFLAEYSNMFIVSAVAVTFFSAAITALCCRALSGFSSRPTCSSLFSSGCDGRTPGCGLISCSICPGRGSFRCRSSTWWLPEEC